MTAWLEAFVASLLRWPDGYVRKVGNTLETAAGGGGGGGGSLAGLSDVAIVSPANGQVLTYNASSGKWENAAPTGGGGGLPWANVGPVVSNVNTWPSPGAWAVVDYV